MSLQDIYPTHRLNDPWTSTQPVAHKPRLKEVVLNTVEDHPGITAGEIGDKHPRMPGLWKRLPELERDGLIFRGEPRVYDGSGKYQATWYIKEKQLQMWSM